MKKRNWPASTIKEVTLGDLKPYSNNARQHSEEQVAQIAKSIEQWGWTIPLLIDEDMNLIAGHGRIEAAKLLGIDTAPAMVAKGWTAEQKRAYIIADNKLAENATWDTKILKAEIVSLEELGMDMRLAGFTAEEIAYHIRTGGNKEESADEVQEPRETAVTKLGDLWEMEGHMLICGDATNPAAVSTLLVGEVPDIIVTDPPYGVEYDAEWRKKLDLDDAEYTGDGSQIQNDNRVDWRGAYGLVNAPIIYVWHAGQLAAPVAASIEACDYEIRSQIIWVKDSLIIGRGNYHPAHEPCWYAVKKGAKANWKGGRKKCTTWFIKSVVQKDRIGHPTQKPVGAMARPILNHTDLGGLVYDPFTGSGTTLIACEMEGRKFAGCELSPLWVDVVVRRWQNFTGKDAKRWTDGQTFNACEAQTIAEEGL